MLPDSSESKSEQTSFGDRLNHLFAMMRTPAGDQEYTGKGVAAAVGLSASHLSELRRGVKTNPSMRIIHALSEFFGVRPAYLLGDRAAVEEVEAELVARRAMRDAKVQDLTTRAAGLDARQRAAMLRLIADALNANPDA